MKQKLKGWVEEPMVKEEETVNFSPPKELDKWEAVNERQDGLQLIKILHQLAHDKDGNKAGIQEIVDLEVVAPPELGKASGAGPRAIPMVAMPSGGGRGVEEVALGREL